MTVLSAQAWATNGEMIADVARLGYISEDSYTLDCTYGEGTFWTVFRPNVLVAHDLKTDGVDFTMLPHPDDEFDVVVFDPPYKLNGRPDPAVDDRYGVGTFTRWQDRIQLMVDGFDECARVLRPGGYLLFKCMDQVCSGAVRWQSYAFITKGFADHGLHLEDQLLYLRAPRPQPEGRRQLHSLRNYSNLLIFRK